MKEKLSYLNLLNPNFYNYLKEEELAFKEHSRKIVKDKYIQMSNIKNLDTLSIYYGKTPKTIIKVIYSINYKEDKTQFRLEKINDYNGKIRGLLKRFSENKHLISTSSLQTRQSLLNKINEICLEDKTRVNLL